MTGPHTLLASTSTSTTTILVLVLYIVPRPTSTSPILLLRPRFSCLVASGLYHVQDKLLRRILKKKLEAEDEKQKLLWWLSNLLH